MNNMSASISIQCGAEHYRQGPEFNISLNRHVRCTLKSNRMSITFWNHQTFNFKDSWVLVRSSWSISWIFSLFAFHQRVAMWTYCKLKMFTLFRFYKYFTNDFNIKYLLVNNLNLSEIFVKSWLSLFPIKTLNPNKLVKFSDF